MSATTTTTTTTRLNPVVEIVNVLREVHPDMTLNQLSVLLLVATNPGISQAEIMERTGLTDSSASRIVALLSEYGNRGTGPFHLIELVPSDRDRRVKSLHLTKRGMSLMQKLIGALKRGG